MKKQTKNTIFMIAVLVILIGSLVALSILTKEQKKTNAANQPKQTAAKEHKVNGLSLDKQPVIGKKDAPVTMILFSDFSCPHCSLFDKTVLPKIKSDLVDKGKAKLYFMNFPFINASSTVAASASEASVKGSSTATPGFQYLGSTSCMRASKASGSSVGRLRKSIPPQPLKSNREHKGKRSWLNRERCMGKGVK